MRKAILLAGGNIARPEILLEYLDDNTDIICVDRGCNYALEHDLDIKLAIGDFDSINEDVYKDIQGRDIERLTFNADKDQTDLQLALDYCHERLYSEVYLFGAIGTRMDHSMANIYFLYKYRGCFDKLIIIDETNIIFLVTGSCTIKEKEGFNLSFMIASDKPTISVSGVKWPLLSHEMVLGDSLTISNKIVEKEATVQVENGLVFCFLSKD